MSRQQCKLCTQREGGARQRPTSRAQCDSVAAAESCHVEVLLVVAAGNCVQWLVVAAKALATFEAHRRQQRLQQQRAVPGSPALRAAPEDGRLHSWEDTGAQLALRTWECSTIWRPHPAAAGGSGGSAATVAVGGAAFPWGPQPISPAISHVPTRRRLPAKHNLTERCLERAPGRSQA